jgi:hypothetical protein
LERHRVCRAVVSRLQQSYSYYFYFDFGPSCIFSSCYKISAIQGEETERTADHHAGGLQSARRLHAVLALLPADGTETLRYFFVGFSLIGLVLVLFLSSLAFAGYEAFLALKKAIQYLRNRKAKVAPQNKAHVTSLDDSNIKLEDNLSVMSKGTYF